MKKNIIYILLFSCSCTTYAQRIIRCCDSSFFNNERNIYYKLTDTKISGIIKIVDCIDSSLVLQEGVYQSGIPKIVRTFWPNGGLKEYVNFYTNDYLGFAENLLPKSINLKSNSCKFYLRSDSLYPIEYNIFFNYDSLAYRVSFYKNGSIRFFQYEKANSLIQRISYNENGYVIIKEFSLDPKTIYQENFEEGVKVSEGKLVLGAVENENGELVEGFYKNGVWIFYNKLGIKVKEENYRLGVVVDK